MAVVGVTIALVIAWHIYLEEMEEEGGSPDDDPFGSEPVPHMQNEPDDNDQRYAALTITDGRATRRCGDPMPLCGNARAGVSQIVRH
jgi:hypothetical protein